MADDQNITPFLEKHLDDMRGIVKWVISFSFVATILALQGEEQITILNLELTRQQAFFVFSAIYLILCLGIWENIRRMRFHITNLSISKLDTVFRDIASHHWLFNPFSHYIYCKNNVTYYGFSGLIVCFWLCLSGVYILVPLKFSSGNPIFDLWDQGWDAWDGSSWLELIGESYLFFVPILILVGFGVLIIDEIIIIFREAKERIDTTKDSSLMNLLTQVENEIRKAEKTGSVIGAVLFGAVMIGGGVFKAMMPWLF